MGSMIAEIGPPRDTAVALMAGRLHQPAPPVTGITTLGTIRCGMETMRHAWPNLEHKFSVDGFSSTADGFPACGSRVPATFLQEHPVDLLVVDLGQASPPRSGSTDKTDFWLSLQTTTYAANRPRVVLESWPSDAVGWIRSPTSKSRRTAWSNLGYTSRYRVIDSLAHGGAINQSRLIVARVRQDLDPGWIWPLPLRGPTDRPMGNLLTPWGLLPRHVKRTKAPTGFHRLPDSLTDPMPNQLGAFISTPHGSRRLQADELAKGLGCTSQDVQSLPVSAATLRHTTSVFIWEALADTIAGITTNPTEAIDLFTDWVRLDQQHFGDPPAGLANETLEVGRSPETYDWRPPDLTPGKEWYNRRVANLRSAASTYGRRAKALIQEGIKMLEVHRRNYNSEGPCLRQLQLLWWEFPPEHWDPIREGSRVGFLSTPPAVVHSNSDMTPEQLRVAAQFVDELLDIGAVGPAPTGDQPVTNTPLFCVEKPHQENEWRVIADCKAGGQNEHIGGDPVYLNRPLHILEQMYSGGYTAVADASKFFYQFPTHPDDQRYLGLIHPVTGKWYVWKGCPMGSGSSPGLAGRYGLALVRMLKEHSRWFRSRSVANCYWSELHNEGYDPSRGYGFSLIRSDGHPAVKIWVFVDDFAIHGPDYKSTAAGLSAFLDLAVDVGLLVHPKKLSPPAQVQKYIGFIFDTRGSPVLRVPTDKAERSLAMAEYLRSVPDGQPFSRLALSVIAGTLESIADATPNRIGHTHLKATHSLIHPEGSPGGRAVYYTTCFIPEAVKKEMSWWIRLLQDNRGRGLRTARSSTLVPTWGDGSGTGTGGTILLPDQPLHVWMGQWSPTVYHFSSNWKELKTLLLTLQQLRSRSATTLRGATVFYFTDNSASYYIVSSGSSTSPGLHQLVEQIQLLVLDMEIILEAVHVPGVVMITQGTDGLSRGVWLSSLHPERNQLEITRAVFDPIEPDWNLALEYASALGNVLPVYLHDWHQPTGASLFDHLSVWFPPPELARQCLIGILEAWVERPQSTGALLFIPRTLARCWLGLSRHIRLVDTIFPAERPLRFPPLLPIPILVLYLAPHTPSLPSHSRLDPSPKPKGFRWHDHEASLVRGM